MTFSKAPLSSYPIKNEPHFIELVSGISANMTTVKAVKHINFASFDDKIGPVSSLLAKSTWDTTLHPAIVKPTYDSELSHTARTALKGSGLGNRLVMALQKKYKIEEEIGLDKIVKDELSSCFIPTPSHPARMLSCSSFRFSDLRYHISNKSRTLVRIGGHESYSFSASVDIDLQVPTGSDHSVEERNKNPHYRTCLASKKDCNRQRPCGRCVRGGLGFGDCIPEDPSNARNGQYGGNHGKGWRKKKSTTEPYSNADGGGT